MVDPDTGELICLSGEIAEATVAPSLSELSQQSIDAVKCSFPSSKSASSLVSQRNLSGSSSLDPEITSEASYGEGSSQELQLPGLARIPSDHAAES